MLRTLAASALALSALGLMGPLGASPALAQQSEAAASPGVRHEGVLTVIWGDTREQLASTEAEHDHAADGGGQLLFTLNTADGRRVPLDVAPGLRNEAVASFNKQVTVVGSAAEGATGDGRISVSAIEPSAVEAQAAEQEANVRGTKRVLYILLKFKGDAQEPFKPAHYAALTNPLKGSAKVPATINAFYKAVSYGKFQWTGMVAGNRWFTLSRTHADICGTSRTGACPNMNLASDEGMELAKKFVDVRKFDTINFVFNNDTNCCAYGGGYVYANKLYGATWGPPWGQGAGVYVHELGHSLGLPHSGWRYGTYDSNHDQMSRGAVAKLVTCATYNSINHNKKMPVGCDEPGGGYIMGHQMHLGWIPTANKAIHKTKTTATYNVEANARPLGKGVKVVVVCIAGSPCTSSSPGGRFVTIEVKTKSATFDRGVPSEGVVIHDVAMARGPIHGRCYVNPQTGWAMPFDATPGDWDPNTCTGKGLSNMAYKPGQKLDVAEFGIKVEVLSRAKDVYKVRVTKSK